MYTKLRRIPLTKNDWKIRKDAVIKVTASFGFV